MFIRKKLQLYFGDVPARFALFVAITSDHKTTYLHRGALGYIFGLSPEMVHNERSSSFQFLSGLFEPYWGPAMNDLLEDPQGKFFIDANQYTDIALHMVQYMSTGLPYAPPAGYPDLVINVALQIILLSTLPSFYNTSHYGRDLSKNPG